MSQEMMTAIHRLLQHCKQVELPPYRKSIMERRVPLQNRAVDRASKQLLKTLECSLELFEHSVM